LRRQHREAAYVKTGVVIAGIATAASLLVGCGTAVSTTTWQGEEAVFPTPATLAEQSGSCYEAITAVATGATIVVQVTGPTYKNDCDLDSVWSQTGGDSISHVRTTLTMLDSLPPSITLVCTVQQYDGKPDDIARAYSDTSLSSKVTAESFCHK
jgi:hypothetical protein